MTKKKLLKLMTGLGCCACLCGAVAFAGGCAQNNNSASESSSSQLEEQSTYTVKFDVCIDLQTNTILDRTVEANQVVDEPTVVIRDENPRNLQIVGWYTDPEYTMQWDFDFDLVTSDITLYAKWEGRYTVDFYLGDSTKPIVSTLIKEGRKAEPCEDKCYGYDVIGYYTSPDYTEAFDFEQPITGDEKIYIQVKDYLYYDANSIVNGFASFAGAGGVGGSPTAGTISYEEKDGESYARVDFGYSTSADPYIAVEYTDVNIRKSQSIEVTFKNLGDAYQMALLWVAKDEYGYVGKSEYDGTNSYYYDLGAYRNMSEDDEWVTIRFDLAELNLNWRESTSLFSLRFQSCYNSHNPTENPNTHCKEETTPNVMLIKSIKGVYDPDYDPDRCLVTYHLGETTYSERVDQGASLDLSEAKGGYKILGYYTDEAYENAFNADTPITSDTELYVKVADQLYYNGLSIAQDFEAYAGKGGTGGEPTEGSVVYEEKNGESYVRADFGYSNSPDPYIAIHNMEIDITKTQTLDITFKNLGDSYELALFWVVKDAQGNYLGNKDFSAANSKYYNIQGYRNMSEDGEWVTLRFELAAENANWRNAATLCALRLQSSYNSYNPTENPNTHCKEETTPNVMLIQSIAGVYDEEYDASRPLVTYHLGSNVSSERVESGKKLERNDAACVGYKVLGYYQDAEFTIPFDFNSVITEDTDIYVKTEDKLYFSAASLESFKAYPPTNGDGEAGSVTLSDDGEYAVVDFGYAFTLADAHIAITNVQIDKADCSKLLITMKNIGGAKNFAIYWQGIDKNGNEKKDWNSKWATYAAFGADEIEMSADGEWITLTIDLSGVAAWTNLETITAFRIESNYIATSETDHNNVWYIKEIEGVK